MVKQVFEEYLNTLKDIENKIKNLKGFMIGYVNGISDDMRVQQEEVPTLPDEDGEDEMLYNTFLNEKPVSKNVLDVFYNLALDNQIKLNCTIKDGKINYKTL